MAFPVGDKRSTVGRASIFEAGLKPAKVVASFVIQRHVRRCASLSVEIRDRGVRGRGSFLLVQTHFTLAESRVGTEIERNSTFRGSVVERALAITL